jgi:DNA-binding SARP family transcriptional activator/WD40 repeat protein
LTPDPWGLRLRGVDIGVLGPVRVDGAGPLEPRDRMALTVLVVLRGQVVARDRFVEALWGEHPPASWAKQVQICVGRLRKALGTAAIETASGGYRLAIDDDELDVARFEELVTRARLLRAAGEADRSASSYARALALWRGPPFGETDGWMPARIEAARLEELRRTAEEEGLDARLAAGEHREVAVEAEALAAAEPLRERRWALLALARYRCGRQADALAALRLAKRTLGDQLGLDPGVELVRLEAAILRQDPSLSAVPQPAAVSDACPYKGLAPYDSVDADAFFGRDPEVAACLDRLRSSPLLVVAGPSGSGKSSLVRAGVVPALRRRGRAAVVFVPGQDPEAALADAVASVDDPTVLVVDQFEELFALGGQPEAIRRFCRRLAEYALDRDAVVIAVRSDHLGGLGGDAAFSRLVEQGLHLVTPLVGDLLREAIEKPAALAGLRLEAGLVDVLVRDCEGEPGALPLLSHALAETWRRRDGNVLTVEGYRASGGIHGAVARSADRLYDSLSPGQRAMLRSVLLRLVTTSPGGVPVRTPIPSRNLLGDAERERVVALLVRSRLVTAEQDSFEVAHEALVRAWPRLQAWLEDDTAGQRILQHLGASADGWESLGRPTTELYRGARLDTTLEWQDTTAPDLTQLERDFLEASAEQAASESRLLAERARREARHNRRLRAALAAASVLLLVSSMAGVVAVRGRQDARSQRDAARLAQDDAELEALVNRSIGLRSTDRGVAALFAVEAFRRRPDARSWSTLLSTFTAAPSFLGYHYLPGGCLAGDVVPGTTTAVVALDDGQLGMLDLVSGELDRRFPAPDTSEASSIVQVSADGGAVVQYLVASADAGCGSERSAGSDGPGSFSVFEVATGRRLVGPVPSPFPATDVAIDADGSHVTVAGGRAGDLAVYRVADGVELGTLAGLPPPAGIEPADRTAAVTFGPDGRAYVGSVAGPIREIDLDTLQVVRTFDGPPMSSNNHLLVTPDGLLVGGGSSTLVAIDTASGSTRWSVDVRTGIHPEPCPWLTVSADVDRLFCGNRYGVIEERGLTSGARTGATFDPQLGSVGDLAIADDGRELIAFGNETPAVSRWRLDGSGMVSRLVAAGHVVADGWDPTGDQLLVARRDPTATVDTDFTEFALWEDAADEPNGALAEVEGLGWAGDDTLLGFALATESIEFYSAESHTILEGVDIPLDSDHSWPSAGGRYLYSGFPDQVWTIDVRTRQRVEPTIRTEGFPRSVSATRDGERVIVTCCWPPGPGGSVTTVHDGRTGAVLAGPLIGPHLTAVSLDGALVGATGGSVATYDLETLEPIATLPGARGEINTLQFSRDSAVLLATSLDQTVSIYDVAAGTRVGDPIPTAAPFIYPSFLHPGGHRVAVTVGQGVQVWDIEPHRLAAAACELAGRNLTETEWATFLGDLGDRRATCPAFPT